MIVGYRRTSTTLLDNRLQTDKDTIEKYCELYGMKLGHIYTDFGVSGGTFDREEFNEMMNEVKKGNITTIIVTELSRYGRSLLEMLKSVQVLQNHNCNLVIIKEGIDLKTSTGKMFMNLLMTLNEYERDLIGERVTNVLQNKKQNNKVYGKVPVGYDRVGDTLVENPKEQRLIKKVNMLRYKKNYTYGQIVQYCGRNGYTQKNNNKKITKSNVVSILKNHSFTDNRVGI